MNESQSSSIDFSFTNDENFFTSSSIKLGLVNSTDILTQTTSSSSRKQQLDKFRLFNVHSTHSGLFRFSLYQKDDTPSEEFDDFNLEEILERLFCKCRHSDTSNINIRKDQHKGLLSAILLKKIKQTRSNISDSGTSDSEDIYEDKHSCEEEEERFVDEIFYGASSSSSLLTLGNTSTASEGKRRIIRRKKTRDDKRRDVDRRGVKRRDDKRRDDKRRDNKRRYNKIRDDEGGDDKIRDDERRDDKIRDYKIRDDERIYGKRRQYDESIDDKDSEKMKVKFSDAPLTDRY